MQMDLFGDNSEMGLLKQEIKVLREQLGNLRRGIFARHNEIQKELILVKGELAELSPVCNEPSKVFSLFR